MVVIFQRISIEPFYNAIRENIIKNYNINFSTYNGIKYVNEKNYKGPYNPTCKRNRYSWQNEVRLIFRSLYFMHIGKSPVELYNVIDLDKCVSEPRPIDELLFSTHVEKIMPDWRDGIVK